jgi:hypothetical protein
MNEVEEKEEKNNEEKRSDYVLNKIFQNVKKQNHGLASPVQLLTQRQAQIYLRFQIF